MTGAVEQIENASLRPWASSSATLGGIVQQMPPAAVIHVSLVNYHCLFSAAQSLGLRRQIQDHGTGMAHDRAVYRQELAHADAADVGAEVSMCTTWIRSRSRTSRGNLGVDACFSVCAVFHMICE